MIQNAAFEQAIKVTPLGSHRYSAVLQDDWCIGTGISLYFIHSIKEPC